MAPKALILTYTLANPVVGGAFFRALRLACELDARGWETVFVNRGPQLRDPKIDAAPPSIEFRSLEADLSVDYGQEASAETVRAYVNSFDVDVAILGESPFPIMEPYVNGVKMADVPCVMMDQFYNLLPRSLPDPRGVDLILMYGLRSFWHDVKLPAPFVLVPPFIQAVTPADELPLPAALRHRPQLLLIAYEMAIAQRGIDVLTGVTDLDTNFVVVSPEPEGAAALLHAAGIDPARCVTLPVLFDADIFGLMNIARVTLVSNGFIQIMDGLALGAPVIALERGGGVGMNELNIDRRFWPYVSFGEEVERQQERLRTWFAQDPFDPALRAALATERRGTSRCADLIEELVLRGEVPFGHAAPQSLLKRLGRMVGVARNE